MWCAPGMLSAAAAVAVVLAVVPAVTPLLGGSSVYGMCRNLSRIGPDEWPELPKKPYLFTGLLVMPGDTCVGSLVAKKYMLSNSMCRFWKDGVDFSKDIETDGSEVRVGIIQGNVDPCFYESQPVEKYIHWSEHRDNLEKNPVMLVVLKNGDSWTSEVNTVAIYNKTPFDKDKNYNLVAEVVGYEPTLNMPLFHQSVVDVRVYTYKEHCKKYGCTEWKIEGDGLCTWDVSPVRTVCSSDRGAPVVHNCIVLGFVLGFVDDIKDSNMYCGEGRIHYNVFLGLQKYASWIKANTNNEAELVDTVDSEEQPQEPEKTTTRTPTRTTTRRTTKRTTVKYIPIPLPPIKETNGRTDGVDRQMFRLGPLLLATATIVVHFAIQC